jgi:hypothetical protein
MRCEGGFAAFFTKETNQALWLMRASRIRDYDDLQPLMIGISATKRHPEDEERTCVDALLMVRVHAAEALWRSLHTVPRLTHSHVQLRVDAAMRLCRAVW